MLSVHARSRLAVVLVGARNPQNIGAAARAMQDFGFGDLRVVNTFAPPFEAAQLEARSAIGAVEVMRSAQLFPSLSEALADRTHVVGTTAVGDRGFARQVLPLREAAHDVLEQLNAVDMDGSGGTASARVALLFGSEKTGLTNEQLSSCHTLLTIPMFQPRERHLSMNLGQSVAVCLYELTRDGFEGSRAIPAVLPAAADMADRERLLDLVLRAMESSGYGRRFPANARPEVVRQLVLGLGKTRDEVSTWMGFYRQILRRFDSQRGLAKDEDPGNEEPAAEAAGS